MIEILMNFIMWYSFNAHYTATTQGSYIEMVRTDYFPASNLTYLTMERYDVNADGSAHPLFYYAKPYNGQPSVQEMLSQIHPDHEITVIGLATSTPTK